MNIFSCKKYKNFLRFKISENQSIRGYQGKLAEAADCQPSFLSRVLATDTNLTRDQAANLCLFWGLDANQSEYFLALIDLSRSGSKHLTKITKHNLERIRRKSLNLSSAIEKPKLNTPAKQMNYYSSWYWAAIHIATSVPHLQTSLALSDRFGLPLSVVEDVLLKLQGMGLVEKARSGKWRILNNNIHLPDNSPMTTVNHTTWRQRGMEDISRNTADSLHYTSTFAISKNDAEIFREKVFEFAIATRELIAPSPEEDVFSFSCDFFKV